MTMTPSTILRRLSRPLCILILLGGLLALWPVQRSIDRTIGPAPELADVLFLPSGNVLRWLSMGFEGLLADVYWTRAVQYFGRKRLAHATRFEVLGPLLQITTEFDPQLLVAYRFGSVFLAEKPPGGAGQPQEALQLLRRGIVANPDYWRFWQDMGFIYYWDLKDYQSAANAFRVGSEQPGAFTWMKVLAAMVAAQRGGIDTSRLLWSDIFRHAETDSIRRSALDHLMALDTQEALENLTGLLAIYQRKEGRPARSFQDLVAADYLRGIPMDPSGAPFVIAADGRVALSPRTKVDLRLLQ